MIIDKNGFVWDERVNSLRCMKERGAETSLFYRAFPAGETHLVLCDNSDRFYYTPFDAIMGMLYGEAVAKASDPLCIGLLVNWETVTIATICIEKDPGLDTSANFESPIRGNISRPKYATFSLNQPLQIDVSDYSITATSFLVQNVDNGDTSRVMYSKEIEIPKDDQGCDESLPLYQAIPDSGELGIPSKVNAFGLNRLNDEAKADYEKGGYNDL